MADASSVTGLAEHPHGVVGGEFEIDGDGTRMVIFIDNTSFQILGRNGDIKLNILFMN